MSEKLTCSNDTLPDQSLLRTANDPHAAILRWADDHPLEAWAVVAAVVLAGQRFGLLQAAGAAIVLVAIVGHELAPLKFKAQHEQATA